MGAAVDTEQWHAERAEGVGGSEAGILMQDQFLEAIPAWLKTVWMLWAEKLGKVARREGTAQTALGAEREAGTRAWYEAKHGVLMPPGRFVHPTHAWMIVNVDGRGGDGIIEIKHVGKDAHAYALKDMVPPYYYAQCQHGMAVTGAAWCDYISTLLYPKSETEKEPVVVRVTPDAPYIAELIRREEAFWNMVMFEEEPPLSDRDLVVLDKPEELELARQYREANARKVEATRVEEATKEALVALMGSYPRVTVGGVNLTRYSVKGNVQYAKVPELKGVNLDPYRSADRTQVRVTVMEGID